jgi:hypothetical protein
MTRRKEERPMNNYAASTAIEIGQAHDLILGPKPTDFIVDDAGDLNKRDEMVDIDEADE